MVLSKKARIKGMRAKTCKLERAPNWAATRVEALRGWHVVMFTVPVTSMSVFIHLDFYQFQNSKLIY